MPRSPLFVHHRRLKGALTACLVALTTVLISAGLVPLVAAAPARADAASDLLGDISFSRPSGTFTGELSVTLGTSIAGAQIRYTTNGQAPSANSAAFTGAAVRFSRTTQVRAQAFVDGAPSGLPGTELYVARAFDASHDLPVLVLDDYGTGAATRDWRDVAVMQFSPGGGTTALSATPGIATRAGFHLHGQSSAMFAKLPYRLELRGNDDDDADYPLGGMPADSDWVLRGPFSDKSLIRDALNYGLARDMGLQAPKVTLVELYVNTDANPVAANDYQGVYVLSETIKNSKSRLDLKGLDEDDITEPKISGGYIFKSEWMAAEEPTLACTGNDATCWHYLEVVDPDPLVPEQKAWLTQYLQTFHNVLHSSSFADPVTGYGAYIDVNSFVDQVIVNELGREMDAYIRSQHFYKDRGGKIFAGPVWDRDLTFGVGGFFNNTSISGWQYQQTRTPVANDWFNILMTDPAFVNRVKVRWQSLRQGLFSDTQLDARVTALTAPLTAGAARNFQKWPNLTTRNIGPFITSTNGTWAGQVQELRTWMKQRAAWLDTASGWGGPTTPIPTTTTTTPPTTTTTISQPTTTTTTTWRPTTTTTTTSRPTTTTTTTTTTTRPTTTATTTPAGGKTCSASYAVIGSWPGGFQGEVKVTAGASSISSWTVTWVFANGQTVSQSWSSTLTSSGSSVTASNAAWNGALGAGSSTSFGFIGSWNGTNNAPAPTCTAT